MEAKQKYSAPGPWDQEPDELDWTDERTGLQCRLIRNMHGGNLCGYVQVPESHPLHGVGYSDDLPASLVPLLDSVMEGPVGKRGILDVFCAAGGITKAGFLFDVHGGITFSGALRNREGHWFGFDCAHCDDLSPGMARYSALLADGEYRDVEYVKAECAALAKQLHNVGA